MYQNSESPIRTTIIFDASLKDIINFGSERSDTAATGYLSLPYGIGQTIIFSSCRLFMVALRNRADHIYFHPVVCSIFLLSSFVPCLISTAADWMSAILPHMVWP